MIREVEIKKVVYTNELNDTTKGYAMYGNKGVFITARDTEGRYIWVRLNPPKSNSKPVHSYETLQEAVEDKINNGYTVVEYENVNELD